MRWFWKRRNDQRGMKRNGRHKRRGAGLMFGGQVSILERLERRCLCTATPVNISVSAGEVFEEKGSSSITVYANTAAPVAGDQTVRVNVSGTGINVGDYTLSNTTITIPNGQTQGSVTFSAVNDTEWEVRETATLSLSNLSAGLSNGTTLSRNVDLRDTPMSDLHATSLKSIATKLVKPLGDITTANPDSPGQWNGIVLDADNATPIFMNFIGRGYNGPVPEGVPIGEYSYNGPIPEEINNFREIQLIQFRNIGFTGSVGRLRISNFEVATTINFSGNRLTGSFEEWREEDGQFKQTGVASINFAANEISGPISDDFASWMYGGGNKKAVYLYQNRLSGPLPVTSGPVISGGLLSYNEFTGSITNAFTIFGINVTQYSRLDVTSDLPGVDPVWKNTMTVPPANVQVAGSGPGSATLSWTPILYQSDAGFYEVFSSQTPGGPYISRGTTTGSGGKAATSLTVTGLPAGTNYFVVRTTTLPHYTVNAHGHYSGLLYNLNSINSVVVTANIENLAPVLSGAVANQAVNDNATISPFGNFTISDLDFPHQTLTVDVQLSTLGNGGLTASSLTASNFSDQGAGRYRFSGTAAAAQTAIRQLVFDPNDNQVAPGQTLTTSFTVTATDGFVPTPISNNTTSVVITSVNDAPVLGGAVANQPVNDNATIQPFSNFTFSDSDNPTQTLTVDVQLSNSAHGVFTPASLTASSFTDQGAGLYRFSGTPAAAQAAIRQLAFDPTDNQVTPGQTVTTTFTVTAHDDFVATPTSNNTTSVVATSVNDAPVLGGAVANQAVKDDATLQPFSAFTISDADNPAQTLTIDVQLNAAANGVFLAASLTASGFSDETGGLYRFTGTTSAAQAAIRQLTFDPTDDQVPPGQTVTTIFTVTANDAVASPVTNNVTSVIATARVVNAAPTAVTADPNPAFVDENTSTATRLKVADITITDDGAGTNSLTLDGTDKDFFEIVGTELFIKAGTVLNFETKSAYGVTINVDDFEVGTTPDATTNFTLNVRNVNENPTNISLTNNSLPENAGTNFVIGTLSGTDPDSPGTLTFSLPSGVGDNNLFNISGTSLRANASFNFEASQYTFTVTIRVTDSAQNTFDKPFTINVTDLPESPEQLIFTFLSSATIDLTSVNGRISSTQRYTNVPTLFEFRQTAPTMVFQTTAASNLITLYNAIASDNRSQLIVNSLTHIVFSTSNVSSLVFNGGSGNDLFLLTGIDKLFTGTLTINGESGNDAVYASSLSNSMIVNGGDGNDSITTGSNHDTIHGGLGNDLITANAGNDWITGGDDNDSVDGGIGNDSMVGGSGNDTLSGHSGNDIADGGAGNDLISNGSGRNILIGGTGADRIIGGSGDDILIAGYVTAASQAALDTLLNNVRAAWAAATSYTTRTANVTALLKNSGVGQNVFDDAAADTLSGKAGQDLFFAKLAEITDKAINEMLFTI